MSQLASPIPIWVLCYIASGSPHQLCRVGAGRGSTGSRGAGGENNFFLRLTPHNSLGGVLGLFVSTDLISAKGY